MTSRNSKAEIKRKRQSRTVYLYDQAKEENWEKYTQELQKRLEAKEVLKNIQRKEVKNINSIWDILEEAIITAASKHLPKKKIYNTLTNRRNNSKKRY